MMVGCVERHAVPTITTSLDLASSEVSRHPKNTQPQCAYLYHVAVPTRVNKHSTHTTNTQQQSTTHQRDA
eukprot:m.116113 g.116113  ORF g.116113 m.116113 type:complete len:70 (-) comp13592_c1_seq2:1256-1465(-)